MNRGSADQTCIVNEELALYNDLEIGDVITLSNPNDEEETYELTISGIYQNEAESGSSFSMMERMSPAADAANRICVSARDAAVCYFSFTDCEETMRCTAC